MHRVRTQKRLVSRKHSLVRVKYDNQCKNSHDNDDDRIHHLTCCFIIGTLNRKLSKNFSNKLLINYDNMWRNFFSKIQSKNERNILNIKMHLYCIAVSSSMISSLMWYILWNIFIFINSYRFRKEALFPSLFLEKKNMSFNIKFPYRILDNFYSKMRLKNYKQLWSFFPYWLQLISQ
jgi:hypothetical protein